MNAKIFNVVIALTLLLSSYAHALECEVSYRAEKKVIEKNWFGNIEQVKVKSGIENVQGIDQIECEDKAIRRIEQDGWQHTYIKIEIIK